MIHQPIPGRILKSDQIPASLIPVGQCFVCEMFNDPSLFLRASSVLTDAEDCVRAVAIDSGLQVRFRDIDLVRPASGAVVAFTAGSKDTI